MELLCILLLFIFLCFIGYAIGYDAGKKSALKLINQKLDEKLEAIMKTKGVIVK